MLCFPVDLISSSSFWDTPSSLQPYPFLPHGGAQDPEVTQQLEHLTTHDIHAEEENLFGN